jgi:hypothetical protein
MLKTVFPAGLAQEPAFRAGKQSKAFSALPAYLQGKCPAPASHSARPGHRGAGWNRTGVPSHPETRDLQHDRLAVSYRCFRHYARKPYFPANRGVLG